MIYWPKTDFGPSAKPKFLGILYINRQLRFFEINLYSEVSTTFLSRDTHHIVGIYILILPLPSPHLQDTRHIGGIYIYLYFPSPPLQNKKGKKGVLCTRFNPTTVFLPKLKLRLTCRGIKCDLNSKLCLKFKLS